MLIQLNEQIAQALRDNYQNENENLFQIYGTYFSDDLENSTLENDISNKSVKSIDLKSSRSQESDQSWSHSLVFRRNQKKKSLSRISKENQPNQNFTGIKIGSKEQIGKLVSSQNKDNSNLNFNSAIINSNNNNPIDQEVNEGNKDTQDHQDVNLNQQSEIQINNINSQTYKSPIEYLKMPNENEGVSLPNVFSVIIKEPSLLEAQCLQINDVISPALKNQQRKRSKSKQESQKQNYENQDFTSLSCYSKNNNMSHKVIEQKNHNPQRDRKQGGKSTQYDITIKMDQSLPQLKSEQVNNPASNIKSYQSILHTIEQTNTQKRADSLSSIDKHILSEKHHFQPSKDHTPMHNLTGSEYHQLCHINQNHRIHDAQNTQYGGVFHSKQHHHQAFSQMQRVHSRHPTLNGGFRQMNSYVNGGQIIDEGGFMYYDLSQSLNKMLQQFDIMRIYKKFFPHNNYDKVLLKTKSQIKQNIKQVQQIMKQNKQQSKKQNIIANQLKNSLKERQNLLNLNIVNYEQYEPTFLSYGVSKRQLIYPLRNNKMRTFSK